MKKTLLHPTLIKANIALYRGERAETLRLLRQYDNERPAADDPHQSLVLWLEAQAQSDETTRTQLLYNLIGRVNPDDPYSQMARESLQLQQQCQPPDDRSRLVRPAQWSAMGAAGIALVIVIGLFAFGGNAASTSEDPIAAVQATVALTNTPPPDRSRPLVASGFTQRYERGILQLTAIEDGSERVVELRTSTLLTPVAGARFIAIEIDFECRSGICNTPPEAVLTVSTDSGDEIPVREGAGVAGGSALAPVALGRATVGWVVFEVPSLSRALTLNVQPLNEGEDALPLTIDLP